MVSSLRRHRHQLHRYLLLQIASRPTGVALQCERATRADPGLRLGPPDVPAPDPNRAEGKAFREERPPSAAGVLGRAGQACPHVLIYFGKITPKDLWGSMGSGKAATRLVSLIRPHRV
jgi:hypothetical protein